MSSLAMERRPWTIRVPRLPAEIVMPVFAMVAGGLFSIHASEDYDLGVHLRTGAQIAATHVIPRLDTFSSTMSGKPWADFEWLWEIGLNGLYSLAGMQALIAANAVLMATAMGLVYARLRWGGAAPVVGLLGAGFTLLNVWPYADVRPGMTGFLFCAAFLAILELARRKGQWRWLLPLLPLQLVWANAHGSYALGPILCGAYGLAAAWDTVETASGGLRMRSALRVLSGWAGLCAGLLAVSMANPLGIGLLRFTLSASHLSFNRAYIGEWRAPDLNQLAAAPLLITILLSGLAPMLSARCRPAKRELIVLAVCTLAALRSNQFIPLYAAAGAPVIASMLGGLARGRCLEIRASAPVLLAMVVCLARLGEFAAQELTPRAVDAAIGGRFPTRAVSYIESHGLQGPMFNEFAWGAYLISALPRLPVFVDGRAEMYGDPFLSDYRDVTTGLADPGPLLDRYNVNVVLIESHVPMTTVLRQEAGWREEYSDDVAAVFVRESALPS